MSVTAYRPMLCEEAPGGVPPAGDDWLHEIKHDGARALLLVDATGPIRLMSRPDERPGEGKREAHDMGPRFPELVAAAEGLRPWAPLVLDGEIVAPDAEGRGVFARLSQRLAASKPATIRLRQLAIPAVLWLFDCLVLKGEDYRGRPLEERKAALAELLEAARVSPIAYLDHVRGCGPAFFAAIVAAGFEGVISKRAGSLYTGRRGPEWVKAKGRRQGSFLVCGFTAPEGSRRHFGALVLARLEPGRGLVYAGKVGSGFSDRRLEELARTLAVLVRSSSPLAVPPPEPLAATWTEPALSVLVEYLEETDGGLRDPSFMGLEGGTNGIALR